MSAAVGIGGLLAAVAGVAHAGDLPEARISVDQAPTARERDAEARIGDLACPLPLDWAWVGVGRFCARRPVEGATLGSLAALEIGGTVASLTVAYPDGGAQALAPTALQNVFITALALDAFDVRLAEHKLYTPPESLGEMIAAPFRPRVLAKPGVLVGGSALLGGAIAITLLTTESVVLFPTGARPNVLGAELPPEAGYPVGAVLDGAFFLHVAVGEEALFRGVVQSGLARALDPVAGYVLGSLIFGLIHASNAILLTPEERLTYLAVSVPYITAAGFVMGGVYAGYGYRLSHSIAIHFWYDAVLGGLAFAADPEHGAFSLRIAAPF